MSLIDHVIALDERGSFQSFQKMLIDETMILKIQCPALEEREGGFASNLQVSVMDGHMTCLKMGVTSLKEKNLLG